MKRIFSFALGNVWSWTTSKNRDDSIKYAQKLDVSGVEVTFTYKDESCSIITQAWVSKKGFHQHI